jgi:hypothetical protein
LAKEIGCLPDGAILCITGFLPAGNKKARSRFISKLCDPSEKQCHVRRNVFLCSHTRSMSARRVWYVLVADDETKTFPWTKKEEIQSAIHLDYLSRRHAEEKADALEIAQSEDSLTERQKQMVEWMRDSSSEAATEEFSSWTQEECEAFLKYIDITDVDTLHQHKYNKGKTRFNNFFRIAFELLENSVVGANTGRDTSAEGCSIVSVAELYRQAVEKLAVDHPGSEYCTKEYLRLQFLPHNSFWNTAGRRYGIYNYKFGSTRSSRHISHVDFDYNAAQLQLTQEYMIEMENTNDVTVKRIVIDDKNKVTLSAHGHKVFTNSKQRKVLLKVKKDSFTIDSSYNSQDDHNAGAEGGKAIISVTLERPLHGFASGQSELSPGAIVKYSLKRGFDEGSTAIRSATEVLKSLQQERSDEDDESTPPSYQPFSILNIVSDGGPEKNFSHFAVQVCYALVFLTLNIPLLVCVKSCPQNSWVNSVERVMSLFNLGLYGLVLEMPKLQSAKVREFQCSKVAASDAASQIEKADDALQRLLSNNQSKKELSAACAANPDFMNAVTSAYDTVIENLDQRLKRLELNGERFQRVAKASQEDMDRLILKLSDIDPQIDIRNNINDLRVSLNIALLEKNSKLQKWMSLHMILHSYKLEVRSCWIDYVCKLHDQGVELDSCGHTFNPDCEFKCPRPGGPLKDLLSMKKQVPNPRENAVADSKHVKYHDYEATVNLDKVKGGTSGDDLVPSLQASKVNSVNQRFDSPIVNKHNRESTKTSDVIKSQNVRGCVTCINCGKPRVVYSMAVPTDQGHLGKLKVFHELLSHNYVCGNDISGICQEMCSFENADRSFNLFTRKYSNGNAMGCHNRMEAHVYLTDKGANACWVCGGNAIDGVSELTKRMGAKKCYPQCFKCLVQGWKPTEIKVTKDKTRDTEVAVAVEAGAADQQADTVDPKDGDDDVVMLEPVPATNGADEDAGNNIPEYHEPEYEDHLEGADEEGKAQLQMQEVTCDLPGCSGECHDICVDHDICKEKKWGYCEEHLDDHTVVLETNKAAHVAETPARVKDTEKAVTVSKLEARELPAVKRQSMKVLQKKGGKKDVFTSNVDEHPTLLDPLSTLPCNACPSADVPNRMASRVSNRVRKANSKYVDLIEGK